jgi:hypothetical protein
MSIILHSYIYATFFSCTKDVCFINVNMFTCSQCKNNKGAERYALSYDMWALGEREREMESEVYKFTLRDHSEFQFCDSFSIFYRMQCIRVQ